MILGEKVIRSTRYTFLDISFIIIITILIFSILCGVFSLCERKLFALFQLRIGPSLFMFGLLTPINDGIKLLLKFSLLIVFMDIYTFFFCLVVFSAHGFINFFIIPICLITFINMIYNVLVFIYIEIIGEIAGIYVVGCYLFAGVYAFMSAFRHILLCIINEFSSFLIIIMVNIVDSFSFLSVKLIQIGQILLINIFILGYFLIIIVITLLLMLESVVPFDYLECESELISGIITEMSGIFFCVYSIMEILSMFLSILIFISII